MKALLLICTLFISSVSAQTVYRCGADGRTYSDSPCPAGTAGKALEVADKRSAADVANANSVVQRDQALADRMRNEREHNEARALAANRNAAGIKPAPAPQAAKKDAERHAKKKRGNKTKVRKEKA
jgi:hypothetical protein